MSGERQKVRLLVGGGDVLLLDQSCLLFLQHVLVLLDRCLSDNKQFMQELLAKMAQYDIQHCSVSHLTPASIRWTRVVSQRTVDTNAQVIYIVILGH